MSGCQFCKHLLEHGVLGGYSFVLGAHGQRGAAAAACTCASVSVAIPNGAVSVAGEAGVAVDELSHGVSLRC